MLPRNFDSLSSAARAECLAQDKRTWMIERHQKRPPEFRDGDLLVQFLTPRSSFAADFCRVFARLRHVLPNQVGPLTWITEAAAENPQVFEFPTKLQPDQYVDIGQSEDRVMWVSLSESVVRTSVVLDFCRELEKLSPVAALPDSSFANALWAGFDV